MAPLIDGKEPMQRLTLDAEAGCVSEELGRRGISAKARVRVMVEIIEEPELPMSALAQEGGAFDFLAEEPELYSDADTIERNR
jgi:hypothetical protein